MSDAGMACRMSVHSLLSETYFGSTVPQYLLFFGIVTVGAVVGRSLSFFYDRRLKKKVDATKTELDDVIVHALSGPVVLLGVILGVVAGREVLTPKEPLTTALNASVEIPVVVAVAWVLIRMSDGIIETYVMEYTEQTKSKLDDELVPIVSRIANIAIVSIAAVVVLDSFGYDVTAIIASLGVGGIAVAFASRKTMADVFGGAHILSTKPFVVDDIVEIGDVAGTVEQIGLRSTRIRDFDGRTVTLPNSTIANTEVRNISSEPDRRVLTYLTLSYDTTTDETEEAIALATETAGDVDGVDAESAEAWFWEYGDLGMRIRLEYHIAETSRWKEVRHTVNREIQAAFEAAGVEMALPTAAAGLDSIEA